MLVGYARVSTQDQTLNLQQDALEKIGCTKIFTDTASGAVSDRRGLEEALQFVRESDTLVVWRLDRLGRSLKHLIELIHFLQQRLVGVRICPPEDTAIQYTEISDKRCNRLTLALVLASAA
jgi:DNA invertase Pin-like site-specific DNA recombinase